MNRKWLLSMCFSVILAGCGQAVPVGFYVTAAPPPPKADEPIGTAKPGEIWIAGHWNYDRDGYVWLPGHWEAPPRPGKKWRAPYWGQHAGGWKLHEGKWH